MYRCAEQMHNINLVYHISVNVTRWTVDTSVIDLVIDVMLLPPGCLPLSRDLMVIPRINVLFTPFPDHPKY